MSAPVAGVSADADVLVIGAGLAGLVAAQALVDEGADVVLLDKGVGCGGRLATRRVGAATIDHGAQFFTIRSDEFGGLVARWAAEGLPVAPWTHGFARARHIGDGPGAAATGGDGHPRYAVAGGMNHLAKHVAAGLRVHDETEVADVALVDGRWEATAPGGTWRAGSVLLTAPVPQSLALLDAGGVDLPEAARAALEGVAYDPTLALLAVLDAPPDLPGEGVQLTDGPVRWLGDNAAKGVSDVPAVTVHASAGWSREHADTGDDEVAAALGALIGPWLGRARVTAAEVKRWRYAQPVAGHDERTLVTAVGGARIAFAGDAFGEAKVEGAARSGLAAARGLTATG